MKPPERPPARVLAGNGKTPGVEVLEDSTEERTIECNLEEMAEEAEALNEEENAPKTPLPIFTSQGVSSQGVTSQGVASQSGIPHGVASRGTAPQGVVARVVEDDSAGARTPRERAARRARRATVPSLVPSMLAKSMKQAAGVIPARVPTPLPSPRAPARDPAAPALHTGDVTNRVTDAEQAVPAEQLSGAYSIELTAERPEPVHIGVPPALPAPGPVLRLVERACAHMKQGEIGQAVMIADEAVSTNDRTPELDAAHLKDIANGPLARIFTGGGGLNRLPTVARTAQELDQLVLDELHWALLRRIDGHKTIDQIFAATKIPAIDALKIAAALFRAAVIRVDDRPHG